MHNPNPNILICPDKFKGSLLAEQVCKAIVNGLPSSVNTQILTLGDGGEGSLAAINQVLQIEEITIEVNDPLFRPIQAKYLYDKEKKVSFIEMAQASGLQRLTAEERNPMKASTYGTGELIKHAIEQGTKTIYLFIGGSATNQCGIGMASALGFSFFDEKGQKLPPIGQSLPFIKQIKKQLIVSIEEVSFYVVTDVKNILCGNEGASAIYGPQKGASTEQIQILDKGLENLDKVFEKIFGKSVKNEIGSGAAGGLGGGSIVFLNSKILPGIETIIDIVGLEEKVKNCDLIITGEGKLDKQTLNGKVVQGVRQIAQKHKKQIYIVCGVAEIEIPEARIISLVNQTTSVKEALQNPSDLLTARIKQLFPKQKQLIIQNN